jgi:hypothetical protein
VDALGPATRPAPAKAPRPIPPFGEGPLKVPISTVDWLVSKERLPARYVALRDLLQRPAKDLELRKARLALRDDQYVRDALARLRSALAREWSTEDLARRYDGGFWRTLFLVEMGCDRTMPEIAHAGDVLLARWERVFVEIERDERPPIDLSLFSAVLRALAWMGLAGDERVVLGAEHVASRRAAEGGDPAERLASLGKDLLLLAAIPEAKRSPVHARGIGFLTERALETALPKELVKRGGEDERLGFPSGDERDLLDVLLGLARCGATRRPELEPALALLAAKADHRARWTLERTLPGVTVVHERAGELSRWVTIKALCVMQHFAGLSVEAAR